MVKLFPSTADPPWVLPLFEWFFLALARQDTQVVNLFCKKKRLELVSVPWRLQLRNRKKTMYIQYLYDFYRTMLESFSISAIISFRSI